jgi:peptidyl-prolyl cis-trans isomerase SurA
MTLKSNRCHASWPLRLVLGGLLLVAGLSGASAQSVVVLVNDDPITTYDVAQRQRFLAVTSGLGDKMRARLQSDETKEAFRAYMTEQRPKSKEEAQELQKKFVAQIQQQVVASSTGAMRKEAIEQLIDERLMLQAAKEQKIVVTDAEVNESLTRMAQGGANKNSLEDFLGQFKDQGINPSTLRERIRAQSAWREVVKRVYGSRVRSSVSTTTSTADAAGGAGTVVDVEIVKFVMPANADQKLVAQRLVAVEQIRKQFSTCAALPAIVKAVSGATVQSVKQAKIEDFRGDVRAALTKAKPGEMTPPIISGGTVESHALCTKKVSVASGKSEKKSESKDKIQEEFQLYSRRHLKDVKDRALLKYPKNG